MIERTPCTGRGAASVTAAAGRRSPGSAPGAISGAAARVEHPDPLGRVHRQVVAPVGTALVTGGARGIGAAIVGLLLSSGHRVFSADLPETARPPAQAGREDIDLDISDARSRRRALAVVRASGSLDVLVNNAGIFKRTPLGEGVFGNDEQRILAVNARAVDAMTRAFAPLLMRSPSPSVIHIASVRGLTAARDAAAYSISKALVIDLTRQHASLYWPRIRVNAVAPGDIQTGMTPIQAQLVQDLMARIPLGRFGQPEEVAGLVGFLASAASLAINGAVIPVDGGFLAT